MLTILTIEDRENSLFRKKPWSFLPLNSLKVFEKSAEGVSVRELHYINRNGRISLEKIGRKAWVSMLVFSGKEEIQHPRIRLYDPVNFRGRLCANMAIASLQVTKKRPLNISIGIYDPLGEVSDLPEHFLEYTGEVFVVSANTGIYREQSERIMWEKGAPISVSKRLSSLSRCDLIVAPYAIKDRLPTRKDAIILTCEKPQQFFEGRVYYRYDFKLPEPFDKLRPEGFSSEIFAGALYEIGKIYSLGNTVPLICRSQSDTQTYLSLGRMIAEFSR